MMNNAAWIQVFYDKVKKQQVWNVQMSNGTDWQHIITYCCYLYETKLNICTMLCGAWWLIGSSPFIRRVVGLNPTLATTYGPWARPSLTVACGASAWNSDAVSVLCRERLWTVADLKRRSRNIRNEWMNEVANIQYTALHREQKIVIKYKHTWQLLQMKGS